MNTFLKRLDDNKMLETPQQVQMFELALAELSEKKHPELLSKLFLMLSDNVKSDEPLWGLLHYIETHNVDLQILAFLKSFSHLKKGSVEWVKTILYRSMNNPECLEILISKSSLINSSDIADFRLILLQISEEATQFQERVNLILKKLN